MARQCDLLGTKPQFGHNVRFVFYMPRHQNDYRLWIPMMGQNESLKNSLAIPSVGNVRA